MHISTRDISQVDKKNHIGLICLFLFYDRKIHGSFYVDIMLEKGSMDLPVLTETQFEHKKKCNYHGLSRPESGFLNRTKEIVRLVDIYTRMDSCWFIAIHLRLIFPELPVRKAQLRQYPRIPIFFGNFPDLLKGSLSSHPLR